VQVVSSLQQARWCLIVVNRRDQGDEIHQHHEGNNAGNNETRDRDMAGHDGFDCERRPWTAAMETVMANVMEANTGDGEDNLG
jgi:hypothetical protein